MSHKRTRKKETGEQALKDYACLTEFVTRLLKLTMREATMRELVFSTLMLKQRRWGSSVLALCGEEIDTANEAARG